MTERDGHKPDAIASLMDACNNNILASAPRVHLPPLQLQARRCLVRRQMWLRMARAHKLETRGIDERQGSATSRRVGCRSSEPEGCTEHAPERRFLEPKYEAISWTAARHDTGRLLRMDAGESIPNDLQPGQPTTR